MNNELSELLQDMKRMWALSLAQLDNTSGRRGMAMQMEAVEEMCSRKINPRVERLLAQQTTAATSSSLALPVVSDPREARLNRVEVCAQQGGLELPVRTVASIRVQTTKRERFYNPARPAGHNKRSAPQARG